MGFFNAGLLWFAMGGLIPIIIHLLHRQKFKRIRWAAMEFLLAALKKTQKRLRVESLLLLLIRILILVFLAFAVARPFLRESPLDAMIGESDAHHVFAIDVSYSMAYKQAKNTSLDVAKEAARKVLEELRASEQDKFTLVTMSAWPESIQRSQKAHLITAIQELKTADFGSSMHQTMLEIRALLENTKNRDKRVYLFTDLQRAGWQFRDDQEATRFSELLAQLSARENTRFFLYDVGTDDASNRAVIDLRTTNRVVSTKRTTRFIADVHNFSSIPFPSEKVSLFVNDNLVKTETAVLPPGATTSVTFEYDFAEAAPHIVRVSLEPDFLAQDDHRWLAVDVRSAVRCLVIDGEPKDSLRDGETYVFALALDPTRQGAYFSVDVKTVELFNADGLDAYDFLVLANVQSLTSDKIEKVEHFVQRGGGLLLTLGAKVDKVSFNEYLWKAGKGVSPASLEEVLGEAPGAGLERGIERRIGRFNGQHPIFRTFSGKLTAALYDLVFYKYYKVKDFEPEKVLASFDDGANTPVVLEKAFGEGKVVLFTTTLDHEWNAGIQGHPPYLCLMWDLCQHLASRAAARRNLFVGDLMLVDLPVEQYQPPFLLETPDRVSLTLPASPPEKDQKIFRLYHPARAKNDDPKHLRNDGLANAGKYLLTRQTNEVEKKDQGLDRKVLGYFGVNVPPKTATAEEIAFCEGNLERIPKDEIRKRFDKFKVEFRGQKEKGSDKVDLSPPPSSTLWKYFLYLVLGFMVLESVLALLFGRGKQ